MRLLKFGSHGELTLTKDLTDDLPPYAILSHTWGADDDEVTFNDLKHELGRGKIGLQKIEFCGKQARKDGLQYFWVDTCCIDQANLRELSEAITSMFRWYRGAVKCYVYLSDVSAYNLDSEGQTQHTWESAFRSSRWFTRGWTLQELLAPVSVEFFSREEELLGDKNTLEQQLHEITGIPIIALHGEPLSYFSVDEKIRWSANRDTKKKEDKAYCLLGIFDVSMSLRYGEGEKALARLERKVKGLSKNLTTLLNPEQLAQFERKKDEAQDELITWLAPTRPEESQARVSASRYPDTGLSFTKGPLLSWLQKEPGLSSLMWITGKSGTGKTTLFSYIVERVKAFAFDTPTTVFAYHYCTFSDPDSQQPVNILGSIVVQMSNWQPGILEDLKGTFERHKARKQGNTLQVWELEQVLVKHIAMFSTAIILFDALDESKDFSGIVACILNLLQQLPNLKILVTSTRSAAMAGTNHWPCLVEIQMNPDEDIRTFVEANLSGHEAFRYLSSECRETVRSALIGKADQTFRWVYLTLDNLCKQRTGKAVMKALTQIPEGLSNTYASMLDRIPAMDRTIAREVLLWLSFAMRPMTIIELSEAAILEESDTTLNQDSRLHRSEVILEICHGFLEYDVGSSKVKLAHSSVRDYLLSNYARSDGDSFFSFKADLGNQLLTHKCLTYLMFDDFKSGVSHSPGGVVSRRQDFPLLEYAARYWGVHASFATEREWRLAEKLFSTRTLPNGGNYGAWVSCLIPDCLSETAMSTEPLYYAASFGLVPLVQRLLLSESTLTELERPGGRFGSTALQVACFRGKREVAEILTTAGADFWSEDSGSGEPAWFWAQSNGWKYLVDYMVQLRPEIAKQTNLNKAKILWAKSFQSYWV